MSFANVAANANRRPFALNVGVPPSGDGPLSARRIEEPSASPASAGTPSTPSWLRKSTMSASPGPVGSPRAPIPSNPAPAPVSAPAPSPTGAVGSGRPLKYSREELLQLYRPTDSYPEGFTLWANVSTERALLPIALGGPRSLDEAEGYGRGSGSTRGGRGRGGLQSPIGRGGSSAGRPSFSRRPYDESAENSAEGTPQEGSPFSPSNALAMDASAASGSQPFSNSRAPWRQQQQAGATPSAAASSSIAASVDNWRSPSDPIASLSVVSSSPASAFDSSILSPSSQSAKYPNSRLRKDNNGSSSSSNDSQNQSNGSAGGAPFPSEDEAVWLYKNKQDELHGPFSLGQLREWHEAAYFDADLPVCRVLADGSPDESSFRPLATALSQSSAATAPVAVAAAAMPAQQPTFGGSFVDPSLLSSLQQRSNPSAVSASAAPSMDSSLPVSAAARLLELNASSDVLVKPAAPVVVDPQPHQVPSASGAAVPGAPGFMMPPSLPPHAQQMFAAQQMAYMQMMMQQQASGSPSAPGGVPPPFMMMNPQLMNMFMMQQMQQQQAQQQQQQAQQATMAVNQGSFNVADLEAQLSRSAQVSETPAPARAVATPATPAVPAASSPSAKKEEKKATPSKASKNGQPAAAAAPAPAPQQQQQQPTPPAPVAAVVQAPAAPTPAPAPAPVKATPASAVVDKKGYVTGPSPSPAASQPAAVVVEAPRSAMLIIERPNQQPPAAPVRSLVEIQRELAKEKAQRESEERAARGTVTAVTGWSNVAKQNTPSSSAAGNSSSLASIMKSEQRAASVASGSLPAAAVVQRSGWAGMAASSTPSAAASGPTPAGSLNAKKQSSPAAFIPTPAPPAPVAASSPAAPKKEEKKVAAPAAPVDEESFWSYGAVEEKKVTAPATVPPMSAAAKTEFFDWCKKSLKKMKRPEDLAVMEFLLSVPSSAEITQIIKENYGITPASTEFARDFVNKRAELTGSAVATVAAKAPKAAPKTPQQLAQEQAQKQEQKAEKLDKWARVGSAEAAPAAPAPVASGKKAKKGQKLSADFLNFSSVSRPGLEHGDD